MVPTDLSGGGGFGCGGGGSLVFCFVVVLVLFGVWGCVLFVVGFFFWGGWCLWGFGGG